MCIGNLQPVLVAETHCTARLAAGSAGEEMALKLAATVATGLCIRNAGSRRDGGRVRQGGGMCTNTSSGGNGPEVTLATLASGVSGQWLLHACGARAVGVRAEKPSRHHQSPLTHGAYGAQRCWVLTTVDCASMQLLRWASPAAVWLAFTGVPREDPQLERGAAQALLRQGRVASTAVPWQRSPLRQLWHGCCQLLACSATSCARSMPASVLAIPAACREG